MGGAHGERNGQRVEAGLLEVPELHRTHGRAVLNAQPSLAARHRCEAKLAAAATGGPVDDDGALL